MILFYSETFLISVVAHASDGMANQVRIFWRIYFSIRLESSPLSPRAESSFSSKSLFGSQDFNYRLFFFQWQFPAVLPSVEQCICVHIILADLESERYLSRHPCVVPACPEGIVTQFFCSYLFSTSRSGDFTYINVLVRKTHKIFNICQNSWQRASWLFQFPPWSLRCMACTRRFSLFSVTLLCTPSLSYWLFFESHCHQALACLPRTVLCCDDGVALKRDRNPKEQS